MLSSCFGTPPASPDPLRDPGHHQTEPADEQAQSLVRWRRVLAGSGVAHLGTHGIRHRAATDIANSGIPLKVGMTLTAYKTVTMFMRYVHVEDDQVRAAAEIGAERRASIIRAKGQAPSLWSRQSPDALPAGGPVGRPPQTMVTASRKPRRAANDR